VGGPAPGKEKNLAPKTFQNKAAASGSSAQHLATRPDADEIVWNWSADERTYVIEIGAHRLRNPAQAAPTSSFELKAWLRFYFDTFSRACRRPRRPMTDAAHKMWQALAHQLSRMQPAISALPGRSGHALR